MCHTAKLMSFTPASYRLKPVLQWVRSPLTHRVFA